MIIFLYLKFKINCRINVDKQQNRDYCYFVDKQQKH